MKIIKVKNYEEMSSRACSVLAEELKNLEKPVLGLATGSTPEGLYRCMAAVHGQGLSFRDVTAFNLDEYVGLKKDHSQSYAHFMKEKLFSKVDINAGQTFIPDGSADDLEKECERYEALIREAGGIDIQVLGLGANGHIGFNEPGSSFSSRTHVVELKPSTRQANSRFFDSVEEVPKQAVTMGIETIMESRKILLLVSGAPKAEALHKLLTGEISEDFPASILQKHPDVTVIADEEALSASE